MLVAVVVDDDDEDEDGYDRMGLMVMKNVTSQCVEVYLDFDCVVICCCCCCFVHHRRHRYHASHQHRHVDA